MNTSELMIGDWVLKMESDHYVYVKVKEVYEDGIDYLFRSIRGAITATGIAPIPISVDILEKNGFEKVQNLYILRTHNKKYLSMFFIEYNITNNCLFISDGLIPAPVRYVHQLQHIFRLCGIEKEIRL